MGGGPSGRYLYRLLKVKKPGNDVVIFDKPSQTACGIKPCAWGVAWGNFAVLCREAGIDPEKYVLGRYRRIIAANLKVRSDIAIIDKSLFLRDLTAPVNPADPLMADLSVFDRVVDATGARQYLSGRSEEGFIDTVQVKIKIDVEACPVVAPQRDGSYAWLFPSGKHEAHLGALSASGLETAAKLTGLATQGLNNLDIICSCKGRVWRGGLKAPFVEGKVWGLGESLGLVDPVPGAGIVSAMDSARVMVEEWDDAAGYVKKLKQEYSYFEKEARIVAKLAAGQKLAIYDLMLPRRAFRNVGVEPTLRQLWFAVSRARGQKVRV
jgi:flavin-dependent dehydrogenase